MKINSVSKLLAVSVWLTSSFVIAADMSQYETEWTSGKVVKISGEKIDLFEYDVETEKDVTRTYIIGSNIELQEGVRISDIKPGDIVEIEFSVSGDKKIILALDVVEEDEESEDQPDEGDNYQPY